MAGTLFGLGLMPQFDASGILARGCLLYVYEENTSTPVVTYSDFGLSSSQTWPLEADSSGRLPAFWVSDGSYRARLTTSAGVEIFDEQSITAIGASSSSGGSAAQDTSTLFQTGDVLWQPVAGTRSGWVRCNGRTIGSGSSGATERANADTQSLFEWLWNNIDDAYCAVSTGRGASATADFNANKTINTVDMRGQTIVGLDDMGNSAASVLTAGTPTAACSTGGSEKHTIAQANLPNVSFTVSGTAASHTHSSGTYTVATSISNGTLVYRNTNGTLAVTSGGGSTTVNNPGTATLSLADGSVSGTSSASGTLSLSATAASGGSGTQLTTTPPYRLGSWYIKL